MGVATARSCRTRALRANNKRTAKSNHFTDRKYIYRTFLRRFFLHIVHVTLSCFFFPISSDTVTADSQSRLSSPTVSFSFFFCVAFFCFLQRSLKNTQKFSRFVVLLDCRRPPRAVYFKSSFAAASEKTVRGREREREREGGIKKKLAVKNFFFPTLIALLRGWSFNTVSFFGLQIQPE